MKSRIDSDLKKEKYYFRIRRLSLTLNGKHYDFLSIELIRSI